MAHPDQEIRAWCISLARAETGCGCLDWFELPIIELSQWAEAVNQLEKKRKKIRRK